MVDGIIHRPDPTCSGAPDEGLYAYAVDPERAKALWQKSEELVGERF